MGNRVLWAVQDKMVTDHEYLCRWGQDVKFYSKFNLEPVQRSQYGVNIKYIGIYNKDLIYELSQSVIYYYSKVLTHRMLDDLHEGLLYWIEFVFFLDLNSYFSFCASQEAPLHKELHPHASLCLVHPEGHCCLCQGCRPLWGWRGGKLLLGLGELIIEYAALCCRGFQINSGFCWNLKNFKSLRSSSGGHDTRGVWIWCWAGNYTDCTVDLNF